jgi:DNA-binding CsgD family transcriptional regulator
MSKCDGAVRYRVEDGRLLSASCDEATARRDCRRKIAELTQSAGFAYFLFAVFPRGDRTAFLGNCIASNWPQELVNFYEGCDVFHHSILVARLKRTVMPVFYAEGAFASSAANRESRRLNAFFCEHGLDNTFAFTLHDADLRQYVFAYSGRRAMPLPSQEMEIFYRSMEILDGFIQQGSERDGPSESLSRREIECLRWSAAGKSSEEIAIILELSAHTVAGYLKSAMRKLDSVNRMQAVARAYRFRLL